jgi:hypothetical protein
MKSRSESKNSDKVAHVVQILNVPVEIKIP